MAVEYTSPLKSSTRLERYNREIETWLAGLSPAKLEVVMTRIRNGELLTPVESPT